MTLLLRWLAAVLGAALAGKLVSRLKLPSILGWLLAGMLLGPHALRLMPAALLDAVWYQTAVHVLECAVGLMIGTELVWSRIRKYGKALILTTLAQSLGTFAVVSAVFAAVFVFTGVPLYLAFIFGGIALATAPAPALSIVREFRTDGPVTRTLIPMAALDDMVGVVVFFVTIAVVARHIMGGGIPIYIIPVMLFAPLIIGAAAGFPAGFLLKKDRGRAADLAILIGFIAVTAAAGLVCNTLLMPAPLLNFMLMGMAFSAVFSNLVTEERLDRVVEEFNPLLGVSMLAVILNLGAPLDYHAILGAGFYTFVYIAARAFGKYFGARLGAQATGLPLTVRRYLGLTLLPHSGVSLVFTGIAVSMLSGPAPRCARIIQGTIAAAAVINEVIAVLAAKKGFEWAGEFQMQGKSTGDRCEPDGGVFQNPVSEGKSDLKGRSARAMAACGAPLKKASRLLLLFPAFQATV
ncbi:MAG: cation:proton antiporter [Oscillibacter sp.]|jgi:Kef-type K+ transport system membrane component KefB|nr:cation:proton antiporter [Oscillibacter sp.]